ncbi:uncharacterized protein ACJ7VT_018019 [Polymixia lowei]
MGAKWNSWKNPNILVITITILHMTALSDGVTMSMTGVESKSIELRFDYLVKQRYNATHFCRIEASLSCKHPIKMVVRDQWERHGRFSLYDNSTGGFLIVNLDGLTPGDTGKYWCWADITLHPDNIFEILLDVSPAPTSAISPPDFTHNKSQLSLLLSAVMCVAALIFVCVFTLCMQLFKKQTLSSDYETMNPAGGPGLELPVNRAPPDCKNVDEESTPPSPSELHSDIDLKHRDSAVGACLSGVHDYVDVHLQEQFCQYQHLDPDLLEEHIYHCLRPTANFNDGSIEIKSFITIQRTC